MSELLKVSSNPHIRSKVTTSSIMTAVVIALLPAAGFGIYNFGPRALAVMAVTIASTVLTELLFGWLWKKKITITDRSAVVTGLLLALNLPVSIPLWMAALGGVFAILVVKMLFGGLGQNFMNPALAARCFLLISFPSQMTNFVCDAYTGATPLAALKAGESVNVMNMIVGKTAGTIGGLLGICPLLNMNDEGKLIPRQKIRTKKKVIRAIVDKMEEFADNGLEYNGKCYISQSACMDNARAVADLVEARFPNLNGKVEIHSIGTAIGSHTGPGTVALFFWGSTRTH